MSSSTSTCNSSGGTSGKTAHRRMTFIAAIATLGGYLFGYDTGVISGALIYIADDLGLSAGQQSIVVSSLLIGAAFGGSLGGRFSDSLGRRRVVFVAALAGPAQSGGQGKGGHGQAAHSGQCERRVQ